MKKEKIYKPCGDKCFESCDYPYCSVNRKKEEMGFKQKGVEA